MSTDDREKIRLMAQARRALQQFHAEGEGYDCGAELLKTINPRASEAAREFNELMDRLALIDPDCPETRL